MNLSTRKKHVLIGAGSAIALLALSLGVPAWQGSDRGGTGPVVDLCHFVPGTGSYMVLKMRESVADRHLVRHERDVLAGVYYSDDDADGFGDPLSEYAPRCPTEGYVENREDCDDTSSLIHPEAEEICHDQADNDCDGEVDEDCGPSLVIDGETVTVPDGPEFLPGDLFPDGDPVRIDAMNPAAATVNGNYFFQDDTHAHALRYFAGSGGAPRQELSRSRTGPRGEGDARFQTLGMRLNTWDADVYGNAQYANLGQVLLSGKPVTLNLFKHFTSTGEYSRRIVQFETSGRCSPLRFDMPDPAACDLRSEDDSIRLVIEYKLEHRLNSTSSPRVAVLGIVLSENLRAYQDTLSYFDAGRPAPGTSVETNGQEDAAELFVSLDTVDPLEANLLEVGFDVLFDSGIMLRGALVSPLAAFGDEAFPEEIHSQCLDPAGSVTWGDYQLSNPWFLSPDIQKGCYEHAGDRKGFYKAQMDLRNPSDIVPIHPPGPLLHAPAPSDDER